MPLAGRSRVVKVGGTPAYAGHFSLIGTYSRLRRRLMTVIHHCPLHGVHDHPRPHPGVSVITCTPLVPPQYGHGPRSVGSVTVDEPGLIVGALTARSQNRLRYLDGFGRSEHRRGVHRGVQREHHPAHHLATDQVGFPPQDNRVVTAFGS